MRLIDPSFSWFWEACLRLIDPSFMVLGGQYAQRGVPHTVGRQAHQYGTRQGGMVPPTKGYLGGIYGRYIPTIPTWEAYMGGIPTLTHPGRHIWEIYPP